MKKICILQNGLAWGGTDTFVIQLCKNLDKSKYDITVVNPLSDSAGNEREKELLHYGIAIEHTCPLTSLQNKIKHFIKLYKFLRKSKFDVFQTNIDLFNGPNLLVAWLAGVPVRVCHSHNTNQSLAIKKGQTLTIRIYQRTMKWLCWTFSNRRCGCSKEANDFLYTSRPWNKSNYPTIIYNPIDLDEFTKQIDIAQKKSSLDLSNKKHILTIGRFIPQKNSFFIIDIVKNLFAKRKDIDLVWIGSGGEFESSIKSLTEQYHLSDRIHFLGPRKDVAEIMKCSDLFLLPSNFEGLGIVLIEAQAAGLKCIASTEVPAQSSCGGVLFKNLKDGAENWAETISQILDGESGYTINKSDLEKYSSLNTAHQMEMVFNS